MSTSTINYELALALKNAGFPQAYRNTIPWMDWAYDTTGELHLLHCDNDTNWWIGNDYHHQLSELTDEQIYKDWVKCPTLAELIEECGENFFKLIKLTNGWEVEYFQNYQSYGGLARGKFHCDGHTKEEAVANLFIALNKK